MGCYPKLSEGVVTKRRMARVGWSSFSEIAIERAEVQTRWAWKGLTGNCSERKSIPRHRPRSSLMEV